MQANTSNTAAWRRVRAFLNGTLQRGRVVRVPYKCNRAAIFDSSFVHRSLPARFRPGMRNRRINLTFLFGHREQ